MNRRERIQLSLKRARIRSLLFGLLLWRLLHPSYSQPPSPFLIDNYPVQSGIVILNREGRIQGGFPFLGDPTDVEALPAQRAFAAVTRIGEFYLCSCEGRVLYAAAFQELNDVDILDQPDQYLFASRGEKRVFFYNKQTGQQDAAPFEFAGPTDADLLANGHLLVCDSPANRIVEITRQGELVWSFEEDLKQPMDALRLENGNTLISDFDNHRVIEVQPDGRIVWEKEGFDHPVKIYPLTEAKYLLADGDHQQLVELTLRGEARVIQGHLNFIQAGVWVPGEQTYLCAVHKKFPPPAKKPSAAASSPQAQPQKTLSTRLREFKDQAMPLIANRYGVLMLSFGLWLISRLSRQSHRYTQFCLISAYLLAIGSAYRFLTIAASRPPYRPELAFWIATTLLFLYAGREALRAYRPQECWRPDAVMRFPYPFKRTLLLIAWPLLGLLAQYDHTRSMASMPWWIVMAAWAIGVYFLAQPLWGKTRKRSGEEGVWRENNLPLASPFTTGSVSEMDEGHPDLSSQDTTSARHRANTAVAALVVLGAALYIIGAESIPTDVHGDECEVALQGLKIRDSGQWDFFDLGWYHIPHLFYLIPSWTMWLFGDNLFGMRMTGALLGVGAIPLFYLLARRFYHSTPAAMGTFLFAASSFAVHFSRMGTGYNQITLIALAALYFLVRGLQEADSRCFCAAGFLSGLGLLSYQAGQLLPPLIMASVFLLLVFRKINGLTAFVSLAAYLLSLWTTIAPLVGTYLAAPAFSYTRAQSVSIFSKDGLHWIRNSYPGSYTTKQIFLGQAERSLLAPISHCDNSPYLINRQYGGMLDPIPAIFLTSGCFLLLWKIAHPAGMLIFFWTLTSLLTGAALTINAPSYQRLTFAISFLPLIACPIYYGIVMNVNKAFRGSLRMRTGLACGLAALLLIMGMNRYFRQIQSVPQLLDEWTRIAHYLHDGGPEPYTYFFGPPDVYFQYGTIRFLAPQARGQDVANPDEFL
ncbi:MAG: glycosyltransferase family 39 protein, partial [Candidatus Omnitrophota bacterium]